MACDGREMVRLPSRVLGGLKPRRPALVFHGILDLQRHRVQVRARSSARRSPVAIERATIEYIECPSSLRSIVSTCSPIKISTSSASTVGGLMMLATLRLNELGFELPGLLLLPSTLTDNSDNAGACWRQKVCLWFRRSNRDRRPGVRQQNTGELLTEKIRLVTGRVRRYACSYPAYLLVQGLR